MNKLSPNDVLKRLGVESLEQTQLFKLLGRVPIVLFPNGPWLAGGAVRRMFSGEKLDSDLDFFFNSEAQLKAIQSNLSSAVLKSKNEFNHNYIIPATKIDDKFYPEIDIQLIHFKYYNSIDEVLDSFDYTLSQFGYDGKNFHVGDFSLWDIARKRLVPHKVSYGVSTLRRMLKYTQQGYSICAGGLGEILQQVVDNPEVIQQDVKYID